jgi:ABC-2 type transport system permease protein
MAQPGYFGRNHGLAGLGRNAGFEETLPMKTKRILILIKNEVLHGPKDVILVMSVLMPILLALFINLAFGNIFTDKAKVGVFDAGKSALVRQLQTNPAIILKVYNSESVLKEAITQGSVDMGFALPADLDQSIKANDVNLKTYIWGGSQAKNRSLIPIVVADAMRTIAGAELPIKIESIALGQGDSLPWSSRLRPLTILMAVFFGGLMLPAASLIHEKNRHTLEALNVTPATIGEIFTSKGVIGVALAALMGVLTLIISSGAVNSLASLSLLMLLGAMLSAEIGLLAGALINDMNTLFAFWKFGAILLFGPAVIYMFPQIPQWTGYFFPTYYVIKPILELSIGGAQFSDILGYVIILIVLIAVLFLIVTKTVQRLSTRALKINT